MDQKEVKWSEKAKSDLGLIFDHVAAHFTLEKAIEVTQLILDQVGNLAKFPRSGLVSADFPEIRVLVIEGNVIFYRITDKDVIVAAIQPRGTGKQDPR